MTGKHRSNQGFSVRGQRVQHEDRLALDKIPCLGDPEKLTRRELLLRLCSAGPGQCNACKICAYGREFLKREASIHERE